MTMPSTRTTYILRSCATCYRTVAAGPDTTTPSSTRTALSYWRALGPVSVRPSAPCAPIPGTRCDVCHDALTGPREYALSVLS